MKIVLTNDDGIDADGLATLEKAFAEIGELTIVAPHQPFSGCGHQVTTDAPIDVQPRGSNRFAVHGTPADCARLALLHLVEDADWLLSGINAGGNLGVDVYMSGTVAAAREAALLGTKTIAFSHYRNRNGGFDWERAGQIVRSVFEKIVATPASNGDYWNVNLPDTNGSTHVPQVIECPLDTNPLAVRYTYEEGRYLYNGIYQRRPFRTGSDVDICFGGHIALTKLSSATGLRADSSEPAE